jgi:rfaE bifunctional protein nucleotidyltransferase chain/domain/rfaE bifunctional protein kinase chain/domain
VAVVDLDSTRYACGGAGNTAVNIAALGGRATLVSAVGADDAGHQLRGRLAAAGVADRLLVVPGRSTPVKRRLLADDQVLARLDEGDTGPVPDAAARRLVELADTALTGDCAALVVCDYGAGTLAGPVRDWLSRVRHRLPLLVVDAHDLRRWAHLAPDLVTPNFAEAAEALNSAAIPRQRTHWVADHAAELAAAVRAGTVAVTLDADGAVLVERGVATARTRTRPAPAAHTIGAGDSYVAAFTLALTAGAAPTEAGELAQRAAEIAVAGPGTAVCTAAELAAATADPPGLVGPAELAPLVAAHRARGRRIVFTNGCFDVLHRGHVGYLAEAGRMGDILVVAVNSDASVRRLKGPSRPVNPVEDRVAVLAALGSVDNVVVFDEDSPRDLIALVRPDLYVKGGDYPPELIPEASLVHRLGGEVRALEYLPDRSTSRIIERIRSR